MSYDKLLEESQKQLEMLKKERSSLEKEYYLLKSIEELQDFAKLNESCVLRNQKLKVKLGYDADKVITSFNIKSNE